MLTHATTQPDPHVFDADATHRLLKALVTAVADAPLDALVATLRQQCQTGLGSWLVPDDAAHSDQGGTSIRPATHLVEISLFGAQGHGLTVEEAARNWRRAALNLTGATA